MDDRIYDRIRWHARRGLLENDILLERFFDLELMSLNPAELKQLDALLSFGDNELLEVLMGRRKCSTASLQPIADRIVAASAGKLNSYV